MLSVATIFVVLIAVVIAYVVYVRPWLEGRGYVRKLPENVETARDRMCAFVRHSVTIVWGWAVTLWGLAFGVVTEFFADPTIQAQLQSLLTPRNFAIVVVVIGGLTIFARLRTARAEPEGDAS